MRIVILIIFFFGLSTAPHSLFAMQRQDKVYGTNLGNDPRRGTVHIWTDPQTGDRITSVRPGKKNEHSQPQVNMPILVYPEINPQGHPRPHPSRP